MNASPQRLLSRARSTTPFLIYTSRKATLLAAIAGPQGWACSILPPLLASSPPNEASLSACNLNRKPCSQSSPRSRHRKPSARECWQLDLSPPREYPDRKVPLEGGPPETAPALARSEQTLATTVCGTESSATPSRRPECLIPLTLALPSVVVRAGARRLPFPLLLLAPCFVSACKACEQIESAAVGSHRHRVSEQLFIVA